MIKGIFKIIPELKCKISYQFLINGCDMNKPVLKSGIKCMFENEKYQCLLINQSDTLDKLSNIDGVMILDKHVLSNVTKWNDKTGKGGYLKIRNNDIIVILPEYELNVSGYGYYGNNDANIGKGLYPSYAVPGIGNDSGSTYGNKYIDTLYHGSGCIDPSIGVGGGTIEIICDTLINCGGIVSNGYKRGTGGTIFICANNIYNYGSISAYGYNGKRIYGQGRIALYCNKIIDKGSIGPDWYHGKYNIGCNIVKKRENKIRKCIDKQQTTNDSNPTSNIKMNTTHFGEGKHIY